MNVEAVEVIIRQTGHPERVVRAREGEIRVGRAEDNDVVLADVGVSRRHCRIRIERDRVVVEDLGSGNGTWVRGHRVQREDLADGDEVLIDPFQLQLRVVAAGRRELAPRPGPTGWLEIIPPEGPPSRHGLPARTVTIGRSEHRDIVLVDPATSRHHITLQPRDDQWVLLDAGSANGVFVNGARATELVLADGDAMRVGNTELRFRYRLDAPIAAAGRGRAVAARAAGIVGAGLGVVMVLAASVVAVSLVATAAWFYREELGRRLDPGPTPSPPRWSLSLPAGPALDADAAQHAGIQALREGRHGESLEQFYRVLLADPGRPAAERLAYAAGEFVVLDRLEEQLQARAPTALAARRDRDAALAAFRAGQRGAAEALAERWADDPVVDEALQRAPGARSRALQDRLGVGAEATNSARWRDAAAAYGDVLADAETPRVRAAALAGLSQARREYARGVSPFWREGLEALAAGDPARARASFERMATFDLEHPAARLRLAALTSAAP